jgi:uncharacterized protein YbcC (UPF0753/DUF2309 family)
MTQIMIDGSVIGIKADTVPIHFNRQEIANMITALECASPQAIEQYLREKGWENEKIATYMAGHLAAIPVLVDRLALVAALGG